MKTKIKSLDQNLRIDLSSHILSFAGRFDTGKLCVSFELMTAEEKERGGDEERERERDRAVVDRIGVATKYNENGWPVLFSSQSVSKRSEAQSLELSFLSGEKEIRTRVVTWAQGRKVNVFCEASCKPEASREKVGFRIRAGWWSSSLCLRAQAELRPSCSVSFPPHLLLSSSVIPRPSSDPASRSLGEFLSLSVARLAR